MFSLRRWAWALAAALLAGTVGARAQTLGVGGVTLTRCVKAYDGYCGSIVRPLDPAGHVAGTIRIGFEFYPHTAPGPAAGTIVPQEGGPGYSTTGSRDGYVRLFTPLRTTRDILLVDKRGTGRSGAILCRGLQRGRGGLGPVRACGEQLGASAWLYSSTYAADDVAAVLDALGTGPVDYYGDSYGTFFGQVFSARHPDKLRTVVLDSAYPVIGETPWFQTEIANGSVALDIACRRSSACRALGGGADQRFAALLASLRASPVTGRAPGPDGGRPLVTADAGALFLVFAVAGDNLLAFRDLDAAGRAYLESGDAVPLLRLVAEAVGGNSSFGTARGYSGGLADAVSCADYPLLYDMRQPEDRRAAAFAARIERARRNEPDLYAPFRLGEVLHAPTDPEALDTCIAWPTAPDWASPGAPVARGTSFPNVPVLVLSGELDTVTSPKEASRTAALFPSAWFLVVANTGHETAIGDGGVYVPPNGRDLGDCVGPIILRFVRSGGDPGDTSCVTHVRPLRTVPTFARSWRDLDPARPLAGNAADASRLSLASAATEAVGDAVARYYVTLSGVVAGLRGGRWMLSANDTGYDFKLDRVRWTEDTAVSGRIRWNQLNALIEAHVVIAAAGHAGVLTIAWNDRQHDALASITGTIDGRAVRAERIAP